MQFHSSFRLFQTNGVRSDLASFEEALVALQRY